MVVDQLARMDSYIGDGKKFRIPRAVRDILGEYIAGLGPSVGPRIDFKVLAKAPNGA